MRINNQSPNAITVYGVSHSWASKDGTVEKWKYRYGVDVKSGDTVQINLP